MVRLLLYTPAGVLGLEFEETRPSFGGAPTDFEALWPLTYGPTWGSTEP